MKVTQARDTESQECDTDESYRLDVELFDALMKAKGIAKPTAQARLAGLPRSTFYRVLNHETEVSLKIAMRFANAAGTSVHKLFECTGSKGNPTPPPKPGPSSPPPPPGPKPKGE